MATFGEILQHRHGVAMAAYALRYYNDAMASLEKTAAEEKAAAKFPAFASEMLQKLKFRLADVSLPFKPSRAVRTAKDLEQTRMEIGGALVHHFRNKFPTPSPAASKAERDQFAQGIHDWFHMPGHATLKEETVDAAGKTLEHKIKGVTLPSKGMKAYEAMGELQKSLEPHKMSLNSVLGVVSALGLGVSGVARMLEARGHKDNLNVILQDPQIPKSHHQKAKDVFGVLARYAPSIAHDPVVSKDFTKNLIRHDTIDHHTVKTLMEAEKIYQDSRGRRAEFYMAMGRHLAGADR